VEERDFPKPQQEAGNEEKNLVCKKRGGGCRRGGGGFLSPSNRLSISAKGACAILRKKAKNGGGKKWELEKKGKKLSRLSEKRSTENGQYSCLALKRGRRKRILETRGKLHSWQRVTICLRPTWDKVLEKGREIPGRSEGKP